MSAGRIRAAIAALGAVAALAVAGCGDDDTPTVSDDTEATTTSQGDNPASSY